MAFSRVISYVHTYLVPYDLYMNVHTASYRLLQNATYILILYIRMLFMLEIVVKIKIFPANQPMLK